MKTITLKLTKSENALMDKISWELAQSDSDEEIGIELDTNPKWLSHKVYDVDKFRKFLIDEIDKCFSTNDEGMITQPVEGINVNVNPKSKYNEGSESQRQDNLKSILNKIKENK